MSNNHEQVWAEALAALVDRNAAVELTPVTADGIRRYIRCRLLAVDGETLLVERPAQPSVADLFTDGMAVSVTLLHQEKRWEGRCTLLGTEAFSLNATTQLQSFRLTGPDRIASGQRRDFFRVGIGSEEASLQLLGDGSDDPKDVPELKPTLLNLSGGGVGVSVPLTPQATRAMRASRTFRCILTLPNLGEPMELGAQLVHLEPMADGQVYLGLAFVFTNDTQRRQVQDLLARSTTHIQRRQIRRQRRA